MRVPTIITVFAVCIMRIVWLAVALPFKHELSVVEFSYPLTWITATVLFAIYYTKGGWMQDVYKRQWAYPVRESSFG